MRRGVVIKTVINGMTFNGSTQDPMQCNPSAYMGRKPTYTREQVARVLDLPTGRLPHPS
jgi:hypothetical protein